MNNFLQDVLKGLHALPKYLDSKYFYDETGDRLFREIMHCPEYYLTNCEFEIFFEQACTLAATIHREIQDFDVVELGAGDALKSGYLLKQLLLDKIVFTYFPVDISGNMISLLENKLPDELPGMEIKGLRGEYFEMLKKANELSGKNKVVLFLGANIGNVPKEKAPQFCRSLRENLSVGDLVLTGFDLKKHPCTVLKAYNDEAGFTKRFNLNLLQRINRELSADFNLDQFAHYPVYDPESGACKSYLVSLQEQEVRIGLHDIISFERYESIFMEISQKYTVGQVEEIARNSGFSIVKNFFDAKSWFMDSLWKVE